MSKARETREKIVREAAKLFNQQGYSGTSLSALMRATGLQKGGIYNHFGSKDELALAAFDFAVQRTTERFKGVLREKQHAVERLQAIVVLHQHLIDDPPVAGGCPLLNTAVESDDTNPLLRERVQQAFDSWRCLIDQIIEKGIAKGEVCSTVEADTVATIMISTLEGAIMMSQLYGDRLYLERAVAHLLQYLDTLLA